MRASAPAWVKSPEIDKYPTGPMLGIPGVPDDLAISANPVSAWTVCDTAPARGSGAAVTVTAIAGEVSGGGRAEPDDTGSRRCWPPTAGSAT